MKKAWFLKPLRTFNMVADCWTHQWRQSVVGGACLSGRQVSTTHMQNGGATFSNVPRLFVLCTVLCVVFCGSVSAQSEMTFPIRQSANHQYLVDQKDNPVFLKGDAAWMLGYKLAMPDVQEYLERRKQQGFNTLLMQVTPSMFDDSNNHGDQPNIYGEHVFVNRDIARPNEKYFNHLDSVLTLCNQMNFVVLLTPLYEGCCKDGWYEILRADSESVYKAYYYGKWIADRFRHLPNIIWVAGGDRAVTPQGLACAEGIAATDSARLHTFHGDPGFTSLDQIPKAKWLTLDFIYTYYPALVSERLRQLHVYALFFQRWQKRLQMPAIMGESAYENERDETTFVRRQAYWSLLSGASGHIYGQRDIWQFNNQWKEALNSEGTQSMKIFHQFVNTLPWHDMEPDFPSTLFISGRGEFNNGSAPGGDGYATGAFSKNNGIAAIYMPTYRTVGVNMLRFSGAVSAKWLDPSNGNYTPVKGVFPNKGLQHFTPPKHYNSQGFEDWVLVLETKK